jgi:D-glycero-D-manno-heptose 1,7-bisphosphate phosphatase
VRVTQINHRPGGWLYLFNLDGTLISSYMNAADKNYNIWEVLPGRKERLARLDGIYGVVTNQGGVAMGHISEIDVRYKLLQVADAFGWDGVRIEDGGLPYHVGRGITPERLFKVWVAYDHPKGKVWRYNLMGSRRKPSPVMLNQAMYWFSYTPDQTIYVGDREEDEQAARAAGARFQWAHIFFRDTAP